jgi:glutamate carboxypeptidase
MKELADYFQANREKIIEQIRQLVEIESPSFDVEGSKNVADWLIENYSDFSFERIKAENVGEHLLINPQSAIHNPQSKIFLLGHTDTVHPRGSKQKNPTRIEDDKFFGCGIFDMKANVVVMFEVLKALKVFNLTPSKSIKILLSCDEEVGSKTGRPLVENEAKDAEFCLVFEPSANGKCKTGRKGTGMFKLKTHGKPAHAGLEPEKGASAILEISKQIIEIHKLNDLEQGTTANVCTIKGGTTSNVIPEFASCEIDVRFTKMSEAERVLSSLKSLNSFDEKVKLELLGEINRPPMERSEAVVKLYERAKSIAKSMDYELGETQVGGASDGNFVGAMGIPLLDGLGLAGDNAHRLDEFIYVSDIPKRATLLAKLLLEL